MTTGTVTPYRSDPQAGRGGFAQLLRAEWTKFRTVRGQLIGMVVAALVIVLLGLLTATGSHTSCGGASDVCPALPVGPDGEAVDDTFSFAHRPLSGDGGITVRVTSLSGIITYPPPDHDKIVSGVVPWAKAGIIIKDGIRRGSAYAAVMVTGSHGVRMQHNFTRDAAGRPGGVSAASPRWLRLTRSGDTLTGYESADGRQWTTVGTARLTGLPATVRVGLFVTSPGDLTVRQADLGGSIQQVRFTQATAVFDQVSLEGATPRGEWSRDNVGGAGKTDWERYHRPSGVVESGGTFTVTGSGDIAPSTEGLSIETTLSGVLAGLIVVIVVAVLFITAEYRRGLIHITLLASPRRGRVLTAKAVVIGTVTFVAGLAAAGTVVPVGTRILRADGNPVLPVSTLTELRVVAGIAALLAAAAVFALALGALFRHSAAAVTAAIVAIVVPHILATASVLPVGVAQWLLRLTPAAGFAIQQSIPEYAHVLGHHSPQGGYYPLEPWAGLAVLGGYAVLALGLAVLRLRRRDA
ncbi:ABC transporter permease subunit [Streptosporangium sp. NPDC001681]|uniref:ABC transporter permease subunit n=1 Tax=Streptosporangium sp. NPDC001681 TaxID=3154395 RepID=UPI0033223A68